MEKDYINHVRDILKLRTWKKRREQFKTLRGFFGDKRLNQITAKDIDDFKSRRLQKVKPASVNRDLATLRHIFNIAKRWGRFYGNNPVSISGLLREDNLRTRVLSQEEEGKLLNNSAPHLKLILIAALNSALRISEILSLKWDNVDLESNVFIIDATNNKSKRLKKVPINSLLRKMLVEMRLRTARQSEYVFLGDDGKPVKSVRTAFKNACRRADIEDLIFHDLRHTAGTRMSESGVGIAAISKIMGHSSIELTMRRYLHPAESLREAVEKLANLNQDCSKSRSSESKGIL